MSLVEPNPIPVVPRPRRVLPLNLSVFEDYMVWDDRPEYPMTFVVRMEFEGAIDQLAIEESLPKALTRHPLLQAIVRPAKGKRDGWVAAPDARVSIHWGALDEAVELPDGEAIDIRNQVGLRVWIRHDDMRAVITTQFHHATCDGIGAYQFLGDWLWLYAEAIGQPVDDPLPESDMTTLRERIKNSFDPALYQNDKGKFDSRPAQSLGWECIKGVQPLSAPKRVRGNTKQAALFPGLCSFEFDQKGYRELRRVGEQRGQTTNELLIERLLITLRAWNEANGQRTQHDFCIMMPMDLREIESRMATAANLVSYALIRRKQSECVESEALNDSLRQEMLKLKHTRRRTPFMSMIAFVNRFPTWLKRWASSRRCMATAIVSNTGDPTKRFGMAFPKNNGLLQAGNLTMTDIYGVPPMRKGTRLTISIFTYRRVLKICLRCDPHLFDEADTKRFADAYQGCIESLLP
ncbi:chromosome condensation protein [Neorhodopirellula pilleata]|uniref:Acyltransferase PapA5 n=1 Tax=Neorhodopirellula pilleata TaxID=2714738 RepID=A0A5C5ZKL6_9BACT|nr:chromosome condensation protein [Neorhodopirellula pilleata]TWT87919.1 acyltransferase PapA5 [Neorhodopirellula pilleata]